MKKIPFTILDKINEIINGYHLFNNNTVCVSYSGGKDSLFLCIALQELGYEVIPLILDVGFKSDWTDAIDNAMSLGLNICLVDMEYINKYFPEISSTIHLNYENIKKISRGDFKKATICTPCFNSKILVLKAWAEKNGITYVANGHHATDAITSFLKSFYMYWDRWFLNHEEYDNDNLRDLILSEKTYYQTNKSDFLMSSTYLNICRQSKCKNIGTDEPIKQYIADSDIVLCRPLFSVFEYEIKHYFSDSDISFNSSECFITEIRTNELSTPREIIQNELVNIANIEILNCLKEKIYDAIDDLGFLKYNVRNDRDTILGPIYKNEQINNIKF